MPTHTMHRWIRTLLLTLAAMLLAGCSSTPPGTTYLQVQESTVRARLRGVSAVNHQIAWASGTGGTVVRTTDGGSTWQDASVHGAQDLDFRDVEAFGARTAYVVSAGTPARIYKTTDGGASWSLQYDTSDPAVFINAMDFWDASHGLVVGDPKDGSAFLLRTSDGGASWLRIDPSLLPWALEGEVGFAGSGTNIVISDANRVWMGFGGPEARVWSSQDAGASWTVATTPIVHGESAGIFSLAFFDNRRGVAVGGDYQDENGNAAVAAITSDAGKRWTASEVMPSGYRSVVSAVSKRGVAIAAGPNGTDVTTDAGRTWRRVSTMGFHSISMVPETGVGWAVGEDGRIAFVTVEP